jgi:hypothetical protein
VIPILSRICLIASTRGNMISVIYFSSFRI